jgi:L-ascorbate metabolism protein UlaG (beta-lactamase superfamily)
MLMRRLVFAVSLMALAGCLPDSNAYYDPLKQHRAPDRFVNPPGSPAEQSHPWKFVKFIYGLLTFKPGPGLLPPGHRMERTAARAMLIRHLNDDRVTWIGHATALIGLDGVNILTDPMFSDYPMPVPLGIKRYLPPGLRIDDLPPIDVIVISHAHYDSLDLPSLERLARRFPKARVLIPLGLGELVRETGFQNVREMDWYEIEKAGSVTVQMIPAIHNSQRALFDKNMTLWAGFAFRTTKRVVWFAGDTAIGPVFEEVRRKIGPVDVALVPIGAFEPQWLMQSKHTTPEEAAGLARMLDAPLAIGIHWGTFPLGSDLPKEARDRFLKTASNDLDAQLLKIGETRVLP